MTLEIIKKFLLSKMNIKYIEIYDDSQFHSYQKKGLTHLRMIIISDDFINHTAINRHRMIFLILSEIIKKKIYSITLNTYSSFEWTHKKNTIHFYSQCLKK